MYTRFRLVPKSLTLDDLERINVRFRIMHYIFRNGDFQPLYAKKLSQMIRNVRPRILLTINRKSTDSIDELRIIFQGSLYMHCCHALPLLQLLFLVGPVTLNVVSIESAESSPMQYNNYVTLHRVWVSVLHRRRFRRFSNSATPF